jgi:uncharacterized protein (TIGR01777 family)
MQSHVVIAGGTGTVGSYFKRAFLNDGWKVSIISRSGGDACWSQESSMLSVIEGADLLINLAGKSVQCFFNEENRNALLTSRMETTAALKRVVASCNRPPALWLNASGASIYNENEMMPHGEDDATNGSSVMAEIARKWEEIFFAENIPGVRRVALRISLVLDREGGVLPIYAKLARFWLGGHQGSGNQVVSWIHVHDFYRICKFILANNHINGCVNVAAPEVLSNRNFMRTLREVNNRSFGFPAPSFALKIVAPIIGFDTELVLNNLSASPKKLTQSGFSFQFPTLISALKNLSN